MFRSQFSLFFITFLLVLAIILLIFIYYFSKSLYKLKEKEIEIKEEIDLIAMKILSPECLGSYGTVFYYVDPLKLEKFSEIYNNSQPECAKSYKVTYRVFIENYEFGNKLFNENCYSKKYVISLGGKKSFMLIKACYGKLNNFILALQKVCDLNETLSYTLPEEFKVKGKEVCIKNICNFINCTIVAYKNKGKLLIYKQDNKIIII